MGAVKNFYHDEICARGEELNEREADPPECSRCDGTGDVHRSDGEWLGRCDCGAAK